MIDSCLVRLELKRMIHGWLCTFKSFNHYASEGKTTSTTKSYKAHILMHRFCSVSGKEIKQFLESGYHIYQKFS